MSGIDDLNPCDHCCDTGGRCVVVALPDCACCYGTGGHCAVAVTEAGDSFFYYCCGTDGQSGVDGGSVTPHYISALMMNYACDVAVAVVTYVAEISAVAWLYLSLVPCCATWQKSCAAGCNYGGWYGIGGHWSCCDDSAVTDAVSQQGHDHKLSEA